MPTPSQRLKAEEILRALLVGASVNGLRFGALQLIFEPTMAVPSEPYVNLGSAWLVYSIRPSAFPENETDVPDISQDDEIALAASLRHKAVVSVEVLEPWPHLIITFADDSVLYLNGKNEQYEPWTAGLTYAPPGKATQVIALPGGELTFVLPQDGR